MAEGTRNAVWGMDAAQIEVSGRRRWMTTLVNLADGRLVAHDVSDWRPEEAEVKLALAMGVMRYGRPEAVWCDLRLSEWCGPLAEEMGIRLHVRMAAQRRSRMASPEFWQTWWRQFNEWNPGNTHGQPIESGISV